MAGRRASAVDRSARIADDRAPGAPLVRSRLPLILLAVLPLVLCGALVLAWGAPEPRVAQPPPEAARSIALAVSGELARTQDALRVTAAQPALGRLLATTSPAPPTLERARTALDELHARLGPATRVVSLVDGVGRVRLRSPASGASALAGDALAAQATGPLARQATLPDGARGMLLGMPVNGGGAAGAGMLVAELGLDEIVGGAGSGSGEQGATPWGVGDLATSAVGRTSWSVLTMASAVAPSAPSAPVLPIGIAALSLLAVPLAWWARRGLGRPDPVGRPAEPQRVTVPVVPAVQTIAAPAAPPSAPAVPDALSDPLSGLGNHRAYQEELDRMLAAWERNQVPFALLLVDVDDLRQLNERSGHAQGDDRLRTLGQHIKGMLRFSDRAYRIGGDEFAILLPHTDSAGAVQLGKRLLAAAKGEGAERAGAFAFSAGATDVPGHAQRRAELEEQAAAALAWCKTHGRGSVEAYDPTRHALQRDPERAAMETAVGEVIRDRCLRAVFQPIVDMATGEVVGFEGLTRPAPGAPFSNPGALFEAAEHVGRTVELDTACYEVIAEAARGIPVERVVTINLSPRTLEAPDFSVQRVLDILARNELHPGRVILELTERETVLDLDRLRDNLAALQAAGVRIAADDVGAGNAGLRLLSQVRFDIVKVDLSLVQDGASSETSGAVLRSLRDLAERWGASVIAEGIETPAQLRAVRELGLPAGQGYLIGRPGTIVDLPPVDLHELEKGGMMLQNAPVPFTGSMAPGTA
jgi:diguanylate cyclase (GGDEF)-like protein